MIPEMLISRATATCYVLVTRRRFSYSFIIYLLLLSLRAIPFERRLHQETDRQGCLHGPLLCFELWTGCF